MKLNNEIRFECTTEFKEGTLKLKEDIAGDLSRTAFLRKVFTIGLNQIKENLNKGMEVSFEWRKKKQ